MGNQKASFKSDILDDVTLVITCPQKKNCETSQSFLFRHDMIVHMCSPFDNPGPNRVKILAELGSEIVRLSGPTQLHFIQPMSFARSRNVWRFIMMPYFEMMPIPPRRPSTRHCFDPLPYVFGCEL